MCLGLSCSSAVRPPTRPRWGHLPNASNVCSGPCQSPENTGPHQTWRKLCRSCQHALGTPETIGACQSWSCAPSRCRWCKSPNHLDCHPPHHGYHNRQQLPLQMQTGQVSARAGPLYHLVKSLPRHIPLAEVRRLHQQYHLLQCFQLGVGKLFWSFDRWNIGMWCKYIHTTCMPSTAFASGGTQQTSWNPLPQHQLPLPQTATKSIQAVPNIQIAPPWHLSF